MQSTISTEMNANSYAKRPDVVIFMRKKRMDANSIENIFNTLMPYFGSEVKMVELPCVGGDVWGCLRNLWFAWRKSGRVNHVSGEVYYIAMVLPRCLLTLHDVGSICTGGRVAQWLKRLFWITLPMHMARYVSVISENSRRELIALAPCVAKKSKVIYNPFRVDMPETDFREHKRPRILHIGTKPNKNLKRVVEALRGLEVELMILGVPTEHQKQMLADSGLNYNIFSDLPYSDVLMLYASADIVSFPSLYEGFGMPVLEAQNERKPILASDIAVLHEVAGEGALFCNPESVESIHEGFLRLLTDEELRKRLVAEGEKNLSRFAPERIAAQYRALYTQLLK